ncbi:MAG TPA: gephyrin-like molybdotransferase Glp [Anaerolineales bacterium]|jgi:molybdopterin molybdotransferase|nr:gephyrin-like molybdotransferase Glp [Anaerolineales bacterium]
MPEFLTLLPPEEARTLLLSHISPPIPDIERIDVSSSLGRVLAEDIEASQPLPDFERSTVDGYAVHASDTHGASDSLPAYLNLTGEVPMGDAPAFTIDVGHCALIHTGGMLPHGTDAVVMLEYAQRTGTEEIEIFRAVAAGENTIHIGEDVAQGQTVLHKGSLMRPVEIGGLMALGITSVNAVRKVQVGLIATGDEVIDPHQSPRPGQVRDVNSYTLEALVDKSGGIAKLYGIVPDTFDALRHSAANALSECDLLIIMAGSSASTRDMTAEVIRSLGEPGVLVHGINTRPGKPTILGACNGKAVIGLPGNPVSALVNGYLFLVPVIEHLLGVLPTPKPVVLARLLVNLPSQAGREDWWPIKLTAETPSQSESAVSLMGHITRFVAEPIFGKSNLIFTLASADGLLRIPPDATGLSAGEIVEIYLL